MKITLQISLILAIYFGWYYMGGKEKIAAKALTKRHALTVVLILLSVIAALFAQSSTSFKLF